MPWASDSVLELIPDSVCRKRNSDPSQEVHGINKRRSQAFESLSPERIRETFQTNLLIVRLQARIPADKLKTLSCL